MTKIIKKFVKNVTSIFSAVAIAVQPVVAQVAGGVNAPEIITAPNGVPIVNINSADANGVSQNTYTDFSIGANGLILNNISDNFSTTQLGGIIEGNANLTGGAASLIINEVIANNPSILNGFLEVGGTQANVIVANPYGITCDGCGFINMDRMTLSTGSTVFDGAAFTGLSVNGGAIGIGAGGANALGTTQFDLISRQISVAGAVNGQRIKVIAGRNDVIYATGEITEKASDGSTAPALAIDSSVLGGMYADAITFTSTEDGVGVRAPTNMAANTGGMRITADGRLVMGTVSSQANIEVTSTTGDVVVEKQLVGAGDVTVTSAKDLILEADAQLVSQSVLLVDAFANIDLNANSQMVAGGSVDVTAGGNITLQDGVSVVSYGDVKLKGANLNALGASTIAAGAKDTDENVALASLDLTFTDNVDLSGALVVSSDTLNVTARILDIAEDGAIPAGRFVGFGNTAIVADTITAGVDGVMQSMADLSIIGNTGALQITGGMFQSQNSLTVQANGLNLDADFQALNGTLDVTSTAGIVNEGSLLSNNGLTLDAVDLFTNRGRVQGGGNVLIAADSVVNSNTTGNGIIQSLYGGVGITALNDVTNQAGAIITAASLISISADGTLINSGEITSDGAIQVGGNQNAYLANFENTTDGEIVAEQNAVIAASAVTNAGAIASSNAQLVLRSEGDLINSGLLYAASLLALSADGLIQNDGGALVASQDLAIYGLTGATATEFTNLNGGLVETFNGNISIAAETIQNLTADPVFGTDVDEQVDVKKTGSCPTLGLGSYTCITTTTTTTVTTQTAVQTAPVSKIISGGSIALTGDEALNRYGLVSASADIQLNLTNFENVGVDLTETTEVARRIHRKKQNCIFFCVTDNDYRNETDAPVVIVADQIFATIEAGGSIIGSVSGFLTNGAFREGGNVTGGTNPDVNVVTTSPNAADLTALVSDISSIDPNAIGNPNLFVLNPDPTSEFLLETRYEFIDLSTFLSSDYFLSAIDYDASALQQRLGDAYVETQFIRDQLFRLSGGTLTGAGLSEREIMQAMYDGAIDAADSLNLQVGTALTSDQISALTTDIIWLEEVEVDGRIILVPRVYLASTATLIAAQTGAKIQSVDIALMVGEFTNNGGLMAADNSLMLQASGDILNLGGTLQAGTLLALNTLGDLRSVSGMITATDVAISAENIFIETASIRSGDEENFADAAGVTSTIAAGNTLNLNAVNDMTFVGANVTAGGDASIIAGGDILVGALQLESENNAEWNNSGFLSSGEGYSHSESVTNQVSNIDIAGNLSLFSTGNAVDAENTGNVTFEGANVSVGGDLNVAALQGDVILAAVQDTYYSDSTSENSTFFSSSSSREQIFDLTHQVTSLDAGNIDIYAAGSIIVEAAEFRTTPIGEGNGNLTLTAAAGNVAFLAVTDVHATSIQNESEVLWGLAGSDGDVRTLLTNSYGSVADISGDIVLNAGNDLTLTAVDFNAGGAFTTNVAGDTYLLAAVDTDYSSSVTMNNNAIIITNTTEKDLTQTATFNGITAAGGVNFDPTSLITFDAYRDALSGGDPSSLIGDVGGHMNIAGVALGLELEPEDNEGNDEEGDSPRESDDYTVLTASLPTAADGIEFAYIEELIARDTTVNNSIELLDYHFYDQQQQLSPAFQALVSIVVSQLTAGIGNAVLNAITNSLINQTIAGVVSGDLDLGNMLEGAAFAGLTAGLTSSINLDNLGIDLGPSANNALLGFGDDFTLSNILERGLDSAISSGLSTAVYDTSFGTGFVQSFGSSLVSLATADFQTLVGDQGLAEGSFGHAFLHGLVGCISAEATGADCAAGAVGGVVSSIYAGTLTGQAPDAADFETLEAYDAAYNSWKAEVIQTGTLIGGLTGFVTSGGEAANVNATSSIAGSAVENNYLSHANLADLEMDLAECAAKDAGCSDDDEYDIIEKYRKISELNDLNMALCTTAECRDGHVANMATLEELRTAMGSHGNVGRELYREGLEVEGWVNNAVSYNILHSAEINAACPTGDPDCIVAISSEIQADKALLDLLRVVPGPDILMAAVDCHDGKELAACLEVAMLGRGRVVRNARDEIVEMIPPGRSADEFLDEVFDQTSYTKDDYYQYAQRKLDAGEVPRSPDNYIATRQQFDRINEQHNQASADTQGQFENQGFNVQSEVKLCGTDSFCRADQIISRPGANGAQVPDGYTATDLNGNKLDVIPLNSSGQAVVEIKTGGAGLTGNQGSVYPEISQGGVSGAGGNAQNAGLTGSVPADTPVIILRPTP